MLLIDEQSLQKLTERTSMNSPKVLVASPIYEAKDYALEKYLAHIEKINYDNYTHLIVDNSKTTDYYERLKAKGLNAVHVPRGKNSRDALAYSMNYMRKVVLEENYDYLLVVESDLFVDPEVINRLISHTKPVVGSYYLIGFKRDKGGKIISPNPQRACLFKIDKKEDAMSGTRILTLQEGYDYFDTGLRRIHGCGLGATLIRRDVLQRFSFWHDQRFDNKHPDVYFYLDLHSAGLKVYVDTSVLIKHQPSDWSLVLDK